MLVAALATRPGRPLKTNIDSAKAQKLRLRQSHVKLYSVDTPLLASPGVGPYAFIDPKTIAIAKDHITLGACLNILIIVCYRIRLGIPNACI